jgi:hypothetical protein
MDLRPKWSEKQVAGDWWLVVGQNRMPSNAKKNRENIGRIL